MMIEDTSKAAFVMSQSACAMIEAMGMQAENSQREHLGQSMAYNDEAFHTLIDKYQLGHNAVVSFLRD